MSWTLFFQIFFFVFYLSFVYLISVSMKKEN